MARDVALIQCGDHWENQQRILPLALGLAARGWHPVVMTYARHQGALFLRSGIDVRPLDSARPRIAALGALAANRHYRGVDVDEVARIESARDPARFSSAHARARRRLEITRRIDQLDAVLELTRPTRVYIWNGLTGVVANCLRAMTARQGIDAHYLERGLLPGSLFVDPEGTNANSQLHRLTLDELPDAEPAAIRTARHEPPAGLRARAGDAARLVFVPLQVQRDANILFHSQMSGGMPALVELVAEAVRGLDAVAVMRRHPEEVDTFDLPVRPQLRFIDDGPVDDWCDAADLVVTVNSTVGLTALVRGRPVVALGRAIYTNKGLCVEAEPGGLAAVPRRRGELSATGSVRVDRFLAVLLARYTARAGHLPPLVDERPRRPGADAGPIHPYGVAPEVVRERWQQAWKPPLGPRGRFGVSGTCNIGPNDRVGLTYRRRRGRGCGGGCRRGSRRCSALRQPAGEEPPVEVVVCPQGREPVARRAHRARGGRPARAAPRLAARPPARRLRRRLVTR